MIDQLLQQLVERLDHRYFGKYRGYVHEVDDPLRLGRIRAIVPRLMGEVPTGWAMPCTPYAGPDQGLFTVPDLAAGVWIEFEGGDLSRPIWSGMWWGRPEDADLGQPDSTAVRRPPPEGAEHVVPELPQHNTPRETAEPGVRMWKSSSGHHIVLDDRPGQERVEIEDRFGNRLIFSDEGLERLISNERTVNEGSRGAQVDGNDRQRIGGNQTVEVGGSSRRTVGGSSTIAVAGTVDETMAGIYQRRIDGDGLTETVAGPRTDVIGAGHERSVAGTVTDTIGGGLGITAAGSVNIASGGAVNIAAATPDLPASLNTVSIDALAGNVSINTKLGILQLGGLSAVSPLVVGDGLAIHLTILVQILKLINPITLPAYGVALDAWLAMLPAMDLSYFGFVKRYPVG